ncbi:3-hydroxyacyl-CoA dehydrogenase/enoyl-CoA hydratase family protein [Aromatoleum anaerobium]|uniref:3-hydroxyacyl-CoA dehydrogenase/enoyl-CoA hydratase family protein n=1 Tax=Aromatoleum anaerobium TaxID=182180 RepID=A0ABX1PFM7_9RHOO|nr:3-hydroxyacyl-CoA dehydrogenase/enoyl-CoA hydratase family protein [Aromatoleum anaerobium]MCK0509065.1 3-hydroxyacyl-CoA dehydrogenase NAD-binding domain-containing protein [Aromatoleum anaerobium]
MSRTYSNPLLYRPARPAPRHVAVIGAGTIGPDIGYYLKSALPHIRLTLVDVAQPALDRALQRCDDYARKAVARGKMSEAEAAAVNAGIVGTLDYHALADCDWVIEAATENLSLKQRIFADVERIVSPHAVITSNTSSLPAQRIFAELERPDRATITHFFAPAWRNPAVEVIAWEKLDPDVLAYLRWIFAVTGKVPLLTSDVVCFMLDRVFDNWCNEAALLLDRATAAEVDSAVAAYVHAGPFFVLNLARGNPIITETNTLQAEEEGEHYRPAPIFRSVDTWLTVAPGKQVEMGPETAAATRDRLLGVLFSQSVDILDRGIGSAADLDLGCKLALGFKHGPLELMRDLGEPKSHRIFERFAAERPGMPTPARPLADYQQFWRHLLVDDVDGVKVITLRRPEALNALHDEMTDEILAVIRLYEADPAVRGFVIVGYGTKAFCAGGDIGRFPSMLGDREASAQYARDCSRLLVHLDAMEKPVVAALNGIAIGGGFELAMRCHGIVALRPAWMQLPEITLGIVPGIGAMVVPYRRWPDAAAVFHGMLRCADRLEAPRAFELGIVDRLAEDYPALIRAAVERVDTLAGRHTGVQDGKVRIAAFEPIEPKAANGQLLSAEVIGIIETAVAEAAAAATFSEALEVGYRAWGDSACTAAAREGITAFQQRRKPDFTKTS